MCYVKTFTDMSFVQIFFLPTQASDSKREIKYSKDEMILNFKIKVEIH